MTLQLLTEFIARLTEFIVKHAVSQISVVILASSVAVALATYRRARPRLAVGICKEVIIGVGSPSRIFEVVIDIPGHGGITVHDVGLHADGANGRAVSVRRLRDADIAVQGPDLPHRIDGVKDHAAWKVDGVHAAAALGATTRVRGYVDLVDIRKRRTYTRLSSKWAEYNVSG